MTMGITAGAYITTQDKRETEIHINEGSPAFILDDPSGTPWVMQAAAQIVDQNLTYEDLFNLSDKLQMPEEWSYRVEVLPEDLTIVPFPTALR
jgi:hypothetical protein